MRFLPYLLYILCAAVSLPALSQERVWQFSAPDVLPAVAQPRHEMRGVWLTTLSNLDWPSRPATTAAGEQQQREELCRMLDGLKAAGINTVFFQTRVRGTVVYPSEIEPWDACMTGTPGRAPSYDPLRFVIDECHKRHMQLHAWVVAYPIHKSAAAKRLGAQALSKRKPALCQLCGDQWMMDPGVPGTAEHIAAVCAEIVRKYDVDGINLDYIRYPEKSIPFRDDATYRRYGQGRDRSAWRRDNVTRAVRAIHDAVRAIKPWVRLSCSPVGKYADLPLHSARGWNARDAVYQDAVAWLRDGLMDLLLPMMYFTGDHFYPFAVDWQERAAHSEDIVPGLGIYFLSPRERNWSLDVVTREMAFLRSLGCGQAHFRARFLLDNEKGLLRYCIRRFYRSEALVPPMSRVAAPALQVPQVQMRETRWTKHLTWQPVEGATHYTVYALANGCDATDSAQTLAQYLTATTYDYAPVLPNELWRTLAVTATDRYGRESLPAIIASERGDTLPVQSALLTLPDTLGCAVLICDRTGRTVRRIPKGRHEAYIGRLAPGFYELKTDERIPVLLRQFWKN
ncbi:MAG: family 10 glycosylhydrolase [Bacteroidaceae bacterium]|nr:family 10 glycosylhydrolase [Bacteroidaceae bacterium]